MRNMCFSKEDINRQAKSFKYFLDNFILDDDSKKLMQKLSSDADIFIFSGIIRDFLLGEIENVRDIDVVIDDNYIKLPLSYLRTSTINRNCFGGYKIHRSGIKIDLWALNRTWGIIQEHKRLNPNSLIESSFFNFSAIVFDYRREIFIFDSSFWNFFVSKELDVVYDKNPNIPLCIVNTLYYMNKYNLELSGRLRQWIITQHKDDYDYSLIQEKHFGTILMDNVYIKNKILSL